MLKLKYLFENYDLAKECLKLYDTDWESADRMIRYFRISSNAIYPFRTEKTGEKCVLRLSPVEEKPHAEVQWELELAQWLSDKGFPVMKPYPMKDGRLSTVLDTAWGRYNVSCYGMVDGETLEDCDGSIDLVKGCGRLLGRFHDIIKQYPAASSRRDHKALIEEIRVRFNAYEAPEKLKKELDNVETELDKLPAGPDNYGIVHYDFEADNVMYCAETASFGVIDLDDAIRCWFALDTARAIDCLEDVAEEDPVLMEEAFRAGYKEMIPDAEQIFEQMPLMRRLVKLQEYSTILHVLSEPVADMPDWMTEIIGKLRKKLSNIENSIQ